jgi:hypothetical protein
MLVRTRTSEDWGLGQVQSVIGSRVTVNFEHAGKVVIDSNAHLTSFRVSGFSPIVRVTPGKHNPANI